MQATGTSPHTDIQPSLPSTNTTLFSLPPTLLSHHDHQPPPHWAVLPCFSAHTFFPFSMTKSYLPPRLSHLQSAYFPLFTSRSHPLLFLDRIKETIPYLIPSCLLRNLTLLTAPSTLCSTSSSVLGHSSLHFSASTLARLQNKTKKPSHFFTSQAMTLFLLLLHRHTSSKLSRFCLPFVISCSLLSLTQRATSIPDSNPVDSF